MRKYKFKLTFIEIATLFVVIGALLQTYGGYQERQQHKAIVESMQKSMDASREFELKCIKNGYAKYDEYGRINLIK